MTVQRTEQARYRRQRASVRAARTDARRLTTDWHHPDLADTVEAVVSELVTNAVIHGTTGRGSQVHVTYRLLPDRLRIEVRDAASGTPRLIRPVSPNGDNPERGRGLVVVAALSTRWGVIPRVIGKSVWAEVLLTQPTTPGDREAER
ncbi:ATP-binding protein [Streptomyces sp. SM11]|uniref:ATP-binding protein n=1 Tax=Streptomyces sp. SM11 TaxID=565557 RepID=UPI000CD4F6CD|nr:ATP-binding protein [Streptomyces sp. SM11]